MNEVPVERRYVPRYSFNAEAAITTPDGKEIAPIKVLGLGIKGCRISVQCPLSVGQEFELTIKLNGDKIVANVVVVYWYKSGFAGLHFTTMTEEAKKWLERLVEYIARTFGEPEISTPPPSKP